MEADIAKRLTLSAPRSVVFRGWEWSMVLAALAVAENSAEKKGGALYAQIAGDLLAQLMAPSQ